VHTLYPGYFALVMATGVISVDMRNRHHPGLSTALLWVGIVCYCALVVLHAWRAVIAPSRLHRDLGDPHRGFTCFTFVAASDVLSTRLGLDGRYHIAAVLLAVGGISWIVLSYLVPWRVLLNRGDRPVLAGADGTWFNWVVAAQSVAIGTAVLEPTFDTGRREIALLAIVSWSVGVFLYAAVGMVVAIRLLVYGLRPADLTPPYWIAMGATAITVLAGSQIAQMTGAPVAAATGHLVAGASLIFWAFGSWLIPPLIFAGWWRHVRHRVPLRYGTAWWSIVFPLCMYGAAAFNLGRADRLPLVSAIGDTETWVGMAAWTVAFATMLIHLARLLAPYLGRRPGPG